MTDASGHSNRNNAQNQLGIDCTEGRLTRATPLKFFVARHSASSWVQYKPNIPHLGSPPCWQYTRRFGVRCSYVTVCNRFVAGPHCQTHRALLSTVMSFTSLGPRRSPLLPACACVGLRRHDFLRVRRCWLARSEHVTVWHVLAVHLYACKKHSGEQLGTCTLCQIAH